MKVSHLRIFLKNVNWFRVLYSYIYCLVIIITSLLIYYGEFDFLPTNAIIRMKYFFRFYIGYVLLSTFGFSTVASFIYLKKEYEEYKDYVNRS